MLVPAKLVLGLDIAPILDIPSVPEDWSIMPTIQWDNNGEDLVAALDAYNGKRAPTPCDDGASCAINDLQFASADAMRKFFVTYLSPLVHTLPPDTRLWAIPDRPDGASFVDDDD